jgi:hypothetical protein
MAPAGTLLLFLCTASALLRPALLSSGTDVSFLDRTLLEKDIAAVFNKVSSDFSFCNVKSDLIAFLSEQNMAVDRFCGLVAAPV